MARHADRGEFDPCSLAQTLDLVGDRWTFFLLREALAGATRYGEFRALGIASDVLSARLGMLVDAGVLERRPYQDPGQRVRESYHLTEPGRQLGLVLGAIQQWGDEHKPCEAGYAIAYRSADGRPVSVRFVDDRGEVVDQDDVHLERTVLTG